MARAVTSRCVVIASIFLLTLVACAVKSFEPIPIPKHACWDTRSQRKGEFFGLHHNLSMNKPATAAWQEFITLNQPASADRRRTLWETWASAAYVFRDPDVTELEWPKAEDGDRALEGLPRQQVMFVEEIRGLDIGCRFGPRAGEAGEANGAIRTEVRMNPTAFEWINLQQLWYREGLEVAFDVGYGIPFPPGSMFVKAAWKKIAEEDKPRYYWQSFGGTETYGLVAFHLASKTLPEWFWATWEQVDNPMRLEAERWATTKDDIGFPPPGRPEPGCVRDPTLCDCFKDRGMDAAVWSNYRLIGTQTAFTDAEGRPTRLGNSIIEPCILERSSCMTCHARATFAPDRKPLEAFAEPWPYIGSPEPSWYLDDNGEKPIYMQLDFLWSLTRAKRRGGGE